MQAIHAERHVGLLLLVLISADVNQQILVKLVILKWLQTVIQIGRSL